MNTFIFLTECISCDFQYNVEYEWWGGRNIVALFLISWGKASCFSPLNMMLALYDFSSFKFVKMCFMAQNMVYIGECSMWTWTEYIMYSVFVVVYKCQIQLIDGTVKFIYILTEFLPARLSITITGVLESITIIVNLSHLAVLLNFSSHILMLCC